MNSFKKEVGLSTFSSRLWDISNNNLQKNLLYFIIFLQNTMVHFKNLCNQNLHKVLVEKLFFSFRDHYFINYLPTLHISKNKKFNQLNQFKIKNGKNFVLKNITSINKSQKEIYLAQLLIFYFILKEDKLCLGTKLTIL